MTTPHGPAAGSTTVVTDAMQLRAIASPVRLRMLALLRNGQATMASLAAGLEIRKGSVSYHLHILEIAGLVERRESATVRGGEQQRWSLSAASITVELDEDLPAARASVVRTLATQMEGAAHQRLFVSHLRLDETMRHTATEMLQNTLDSIAALESRDGELITFAALTFADSYTPNA